MKHIRTLVNKLLTFAKGSKNSLFTKPLLAKATRSKEDSLRVQSTTVSPCLKKKANNIKIASNSKFKNSTFALLNFNFEKNDGNTTKEAPTLITIICTAIVLSIIVIIVVCFLAVHTD